MLGMCSVIDNTARVNHRTLSPGNRDIDLVQDVTSNCSVVASICAAMHLLQPGRPKTVSRAFEHYGR